MARAYPVNLFRKFAFVLSVGDQKHGLTMAKETVHGLILGRPHDVDKPSIMTLFQELASHHVARDATDVQISIDLISQDAKRERRIVYSLGLDRDGGAPRHLAIDLDNMVDGIAYDRILFPRAWLVRFRDVT